MEKELIYFNGVDVESGEYLRDPMSLEEVRQRIPAIDAIPETRERALVDWIDPNDLGQTRWGILAHQDEDPAVLKALEPLLKHRAINAGKVRRLVFTEEDRLQGEEAIDSFLDRYGVPPGDVDPSQEELPYYILIVGSPERIPFSFQAELDISHASGRLYFDDPQAYSRYARSLVAQELEPIRREKRLALFGTDNGDRITGLTSQYLVPPLAQKMADLKTDDWTLQTIAPPHASKEKLMELLTGKDAPTLLFTAGHGAVSKKRPLQIQGALICSDWQGGKLAASHYICGADVLPEHDFRGTLPFFFACFTAGTPRYDVFVEPGKKPWQWHEKSFIGALPQALLGHPHGPLAIIAHVDQAFQYSFLWNENILGVAHFAGTYYRLMSGARVGYAMEPFRRRYAAAMASIKRARRRRKNMVDGDIIRWIGFQDARYYTVLGDPAVRLPVGKSL